MESPMESETPEERKNRSEGQINVTCKANVGRGKTVQTAGLFTRDRQNYRNTSLRKETDRLRRKKKYKCNALFKCYAQGSSWARVFFVHGARDCAATDPATSSENKEPCPSLRMTTTINKQMMNSSNACTVVMPIFLLNIEDLLHHNSKNKLFSWET